MRKATKDRRRIDSTVDGWYCVAGYALQGVARIPRQEAARRRQAGPNGVNLMKTDKQLCSYRSILRIRRRRPCVGITGAPRAGEVVWLDRVPALLSAATANIRGRN